MLRRRARSERNMVKNRWLRLWRATEGLGAVELGFIAPFLLLLFLGIVDFGMAYWQQMEIANAANVGTQYAIKNSFNQSQIITIAKASTNLSDVLLDNPAPDQVCGCPTATGVTIGYGTYPTCGTCPDSTAAKGYVRVNTRICYSPLFTWPGLSYCSLSNSSCSGCTANQIVLTAQSIVLK